MGWHGIRLKPDSSYKKKSQIYPYSVYFYSKFEYSHYNILKRGICSSQLANDGNDLRLGTCMNLPIHQFEKKGV